MPGEQQINFPTEWKYRIICLKDDSTVMDDIIKTLRRHGRNECPETGNISGNGRYVTYKVSVTFADITSMREMSDALAALPGIKYLL